MSEPLKPEEVMIRMRDGVQLAADLYAPPGLPQPWPVILVRTPYGKHVFDTLTTPSASALARHGFAVVVQDKRGKFRSEGIYKYCAHDGPDGWDTVEWLVAQSFCNGRIGTYGSSYLGDTQLALGRLRHPAHRCMVPHAASMLGALGGRYTMGDTRAGGALYLATYVRWFYERGARKHSGTLPPLDLERACRGLPLESLFEQIGGPPCDWRDIVTRSPLDPWWRDAELLTPEDRFDVPALHVNSWFDVGLEDTLVLFEHLARTSLSAAAREHQYLIVSPATHCASEQLGPDDHVGDLSVGDARLPWEDIYVQWFSHWLREEGSLDGWPRVRYYELNRNQWIESEHWPPAEAAPIALELSSHGQANTRLGDGLLGAASSSGCDRLVANPEDPVLTVGGAEPSAYLRIAPLDQSTVELRRDVLVYTSSVLGGEGLRIAGPVRATLFIEASVPDIDLVAKLIDVYPDGRALDLRDGILRCRYRDSRIRSQLMQAGEIYTVTVSLHALGAWFAPDHRLRLEIAASSFPRYDRNLQTGGDNVSETIGRCGTLTLWHTGTRRSHLTLSVIGAVPPGIRPMCSPAPAGAGP